MNNLSASPCDLIHVFLFEGLSEPFYHGYPELFELCPPISTSRMGVFPPFYVLTLLEVHTTYQLIHLLGLVISTPLPFIFHIQRLPLQVCAMDGALIHTELFESALDDVCYAGDLTVTDCVFDI